MLINVTTKPFTKDKMSNFRNTLSGKKTINYIFFYHTITLLIRKEGFIMQEEIREKLINYLNKYGSSLSFVAKQIDISRETLSRFKNNKQDLHINTLEKIDNFIKEKAR